MGLSSKQAAGDGLDWSQALLKDGEVEIAEARRPPSPVQGRQQRQVIGTAAVAPLRCPRCDSYNTKFCYYNNYSRSQPRHFCKSCRRHWTNGGTLRNVPIGGGRKNKRPKTSHASSTSKTTADDRNRRQQEQPPQLPTPSFVPDHLQPRQTLLRPPASPSSSDYFAATTDLNGSSLLGSLPSLPPMPSPALADPFYPLSSYSFLPFVMHQSEDAAASEGHDPNNGLTTSSSMVDVGTGDAGSDGLAQRTTLPPTCGFVEPPSAGGYWSCWDELAELGKPPVPTASGLPDLGLI